jgi:hypothetical protein
MNKDYVSEMNGNRMKMTHWLWQYDVLKMESHHVNTRDMMERHVGGNRIAKSATNMVMWRIVRNAGIVRYVKVFNTIRRKYVRISNASWI